MILFVLCLLASYAQALQEFGGDRATSLQFRGSQEHVAVTGMGGLELRKSTTTPSPDFVAAPLHMREAPAGALIDLDQEPAPANDTENLKGMIDDLKETTVKLSENDTSLKGVSDQLVTATADLVNDHNVTSEELESLSERVTGVETKAGEPGEKGDAGPAGAEGPAGADGAAGPAGAEGPAGAAGADGPTGAPGVAGAEGPAGPAGAAGAVGAAGANGTAGPAGPTGLKGEKGDQGDQGETGPAGAAANSSAITNALDGLTTGLESLTSRVDSNISGLTAADTKAAADLAVAKQGISTLTTSLGNLSEQVTGLSGDNISSLHSDVDGLLTGITAKASKKSVDEVNAELTALTATVAANENASGSKEALGALSANMSSVKASVTGLTTALDNLTAKVTANAKKTGENIGTVTDSITALKADLASLTTKVTDNQGFAENITNLEDVLAALATEVEELTTKVTANEGFAENITDLKGTLTIVADKLEALTTKVGSVEGNIGALDSAKATATEVDELKADLGSLTTRVGSNEGFASKITDLRTDLVNLTSDVATKATTTAVDADVASVRDDLTNLTAAVATKATTSDVDTAMAGLAGDLGAVSDQFGANLSSFKKKLSGFLGDLKENVSSLETVVDTADAAMAANISDVKSSVATQATTTAEQLEAAKAELAVDLGAQISVVSADLSTLKTDSQNQTAMMLSGIGDLKTNMTSVTSSVTDLQGGVKYVKTLAGELTASKADKSVVDTLTGTLNTLKTAVNASNEGFRTRMDTKDSLLDKTIADLGTLKSNVSTFQGDSESVTAALITEKDANKIAVDKLALDMGAMDNKTAALNKEKANQTAVDQIVLDMGALSSTVNDNSDKMVKENAAVTTKLNGVKSEVEQNKGSADASFSAVIGLVNKLNGSNVEIDEAFATSIGDDEARLIGLQQAIDTKAAAEDLAKANANIGNLNTSLNEGKTLSVATDATLAANISTLSGTVGGLSGDLKNLTTKVSTVNGAVTNLNALASQITEAKEEKTVVTALSGKLSTLTEAVAASNAGFDTSINDTSTLLASTIADLGTVTSNVENVSVDVGILQNATADLIADKANATDLDELTLAVAAVNESVTGNSGFAANITSLEASAKNQLAKIAHVKNTIADINQSVAALADEASRNKQNITSLTTTLGGVSDEVGINAANVAAASTKIDNLNTSLSGLSEQVQTWREGGKNITDQLNTDVAGLTTGLGTLTGSVDNVKGDVGKMKLASDAIAATLDSDITSVKAADTALQGSIASADADLAANISTLQAGVDALRTSTGDDLTKSAAALTTKLQNYAATQDGALASESSALQTNQTRLSGDLGDLTVKFSDLNASETEVEEVAAGLISSVDTKASASDLGNLETAFASHETTVNEKFSVVSANLQTVKDLVSTNSNATSASLTGLASDIQANGAADKSAITYLKSEDEQLSQKVVALEANLTQLRSTVSTDRASTSENIANLEKSVLSKLNETKSALDDSMVAMKEQTAAGLTESMDKVSEQTAANNASVQALEASFDAKLKQMNASLTAEYDEKFSEVNEKLTESKQKLETTTVDLQAADEEVKTLKFRMSQFGKSIGGLDTTSGECKEFCAESEEPWVDKCFWGNNICSTCLECESLKPCKKTCARSTKTWAVKCALADQCSGCSECTASDEEKGTSLASASAKATTASK